MVASKNEARRLIKEKAVTHEGNTVSDENWLLATGCFKDRETAFFKTYINYKKYS